MADTNVLIEVDAKDLASAKLVKVTKNLKDTGEASSMTGKLFGDLKGKAEGAGIPISSMSSYLGTAGMAATGAVVAIGAVAVGLGMLGMSTANALAGLQDVSDQTGASVEHLSKMSLVLKTSNLDTQTYGNALSKLSVNLNKNADDFKALGVSTTDPAKAMMQLKTIIANTTDQQKKVEIGNMAFGKSFKDLMPFLQMPQDEMKKLIDLAPEISSSQAQAGAQLADSWDVAKAQLTAFGTTIGIAVMPYLQALISTFGAIITAVSPIISIFGRLIDMTFRLASVMFEKLSPIVGVVFKPIISAVQDLFGWFVKLLDRVDKFLGKSSQVKPQETKSKFVIPEVEEPKVKFEKPKGKTKKEIASEQKESQVDFETEQYNKRVEHERKLSELLANLKLKQDKEADDKYWKDREETDKKKAEADKKALDEQVKKQEEAAQRTKDAWANVSNTLSSQLTTPLEDFQKNIIRGNQSVLTSFKDLFGDILNNFGNMLTKMVAEYMAKAAIMAALNFFTGGSAGGALSVGSFLGFNATGTNDWRGGLTVVGERGAEIINAPPKASITPMNEFNKGKSGDTYNLTINNPTEKITDTTLIKMGQRNSAFLKEDKVYSWRV